MTSQDKVLSVFPKALASSVSGKVVITSAASGERLGEGRRYDMAWAAAWREIERRGTHHQCPYCEIPLEPFMGEEEGPVTGWYHPDTQNGCRWDNFENLSKRQIASATAKQR